MKIERLHFQVAPELVETFISADGEVWTSWLQRQPGYINKQYVRYPAGQITILVFWKDEISMERSLKDPNYAILEPTMRAKLGNVYRLVSAS